MTIYYVYIYIYTFTVWHVFELDTHKRPCMVGYCLIPDGCTETSSLWAGGISRCDWCDWLKGHGVGIGQNTCTPQPCSLHKSLMIFLFRWNMLPSWQPTCPNAISKIWRWFPFPKMGYVSYDIDLWFVKWEGNLDMLHAGSTCYNHPPWNEQSAPENGWLEDEFPFGTAYFQRRNVSFREGSKIMLYVWESQGHCPHGLWMLNPGLAFPFVYLFSYRDPFYMNIFTMLHTHHEFVEPNKPHVIRMWDLFLICLLWSTW